MREVISKFAELSLKLCHLRGEGDSEYLVVHWDGQRDESGEVMPLLGASV